MTPNSAIDDVDPAERPLGVIRDEQLVVPAHPLRGLLGETHDVVDEQLPRTDRRDDLRFDVMVDAPRTCSTCP